MKRLLRAVEMLAWGVFFSLAALVLAVRFWVLPDIERYRDDIVAAMSRGIGLPVRVGRIEAGWLGLRPQITLSDVRILDAQGREALVLPSITLGLFQMTLIMRLVRGEMMEVLRADYIKFARARGLSNRAINFGHALKNTLVPVMTITGLQLGSIIAFALITESVFQWPGMGLLFLKAVQNVDIPIMSAYLLLVAFIFVTINLIVDILYAVVDPRIRIDTKVA